MTEERSFTVSKYDLLAVCEVNFTGQELEELEQMTPEEVKKAVKEAADGSDMWRVIESEDNQFLEVEED